MKLLTALDLGTSTFKAVVAEITPKKGALQILAQLEVTAQGVKRGTVYDVDDASRALAEVVEQAEGMIARDIEEVLTTIGGPHLETRFSRGTIVASRADGEISQEDVDRAVQQAEAVPMAQNRVLLHVIPKEFFIDGVGGVKDPVGMQGVRLEVESLLIDAFGPALKTMQKCFDAIGVKPSLIVASPLAASRAVMTKRDRELGSVAIDIGADTTNIAVFEEGDLLHTAVLPLGSAHVTNDLAIALKTPVEIAEKVKVEAGYAIASSLSRREMVALAQFIEGEDETVARRYLADIIEARLAEIFSMVNDQLRKIDRFSKLPGGAVLAGGGARIPGIQELAKRELKLSARIASLEHHRKILPQNIGIQFYPACGLLLWALDSYGGRGREKGLFGLAKNIFKIFLP